MSGTGPGTGPTDPRFFDVDGSAESDSGTEADHSENSPVEIGYVARAHGVRGWVRIHCHSTESDCLTGAKSVFLGSKEYAVLECRSVDSAFLIRCEGLASRDDAEVLKGQAVSVSRDLLGLEEEDVLLADLVGCFVFLKKTGEVEAGEEHLSQQWDGENIGVVVEVILGAQYRARVRGGAPGDEREFEIPLVDELLPVIDIENKRIIADLPEGFPSTHVSSHESKGSSSTRGKGKSRT